MTRLRNDRSVRLRVIYSAHEGRCMRRLGNPEERTWRVSQDALAVAAAQYVEKAVPAIGGHEDQIGVGLPGSLKNHLDDVALLGHPVPCPSRDVRRNNRRRRSLLANMEQSKFSALTF